MKLYGLADCNNFYCSCERVFHPDLIGKPVVVLSNNDGCVIARSEESKALGIKMGEAFYQVKEKLEQNNVAVFSSNYNLYGDMSRRVMSLLAKYSPKIDVYSIDEAFLDFSGMNTSETFIEYCREMVRHIHKGTGIPISLGIAPTKTLAKIASKFAKKHKGYKGVCLIDTDEKREKALKLFPVEDVWGIGYRSVERLHNQGIKTAWDLTQKSESWIKHELTITGVRTWRELRGESCISTEELPHKQSICTSRSFAEQGLNRLADIEEAVANFAAQCARKLREQHTVCNSITIFLHTSRFREDVPQSYIYHSINLQVPTNNQQELISYAVKTLRANWKEGNFHYKKAGVIVWGICRDDAIQGNLFDTVNRSKQAALAKAIDAINRKNGHNKIRVAVQGDEKGWQLKREYISQQYTTNLDEVIVLKVK
ncbi:MAG: Y-family DNA polymerase [Mediterranea massiliensis]|nr:Y-family DNA polymerase [Mediterranea massiliensis]